MNSKPVTRIGVDLGGTKIEAVALNADGALLWRERIATPKQSADAIYDAIAELVLRGESQLATRCSVGIGTPGSLSPKTGLMRGSNTVVLNGQPVKQAIELRLAREIRIANDANCFALSEAVDGAGRGAASVFGVIFGTGCGAGVVINGRVIDGLHRIAGEFGHNPLPWPNDDELKDRGAHDCYCGKSGCIETWLSGTGIAKHFNAARQGDPLNASQIVTLAGGGDEAAERYLQRVEDRMARALATVINLLDPEVIVLGGGVSNIERVYQNVPPLLPKYVFSEFVETKVLRNVHGDSSGVRGAAWLWGD
ncbi:MAG: ROK family protein [Betaproteobacteria bacterium]|nr:MAG: ROK family protein [Betaproteobacteria bacterium]